MPIKQVLSLLIKVDWIKTFYFNFKYFPILVAIHLPCFIFRKTVLFQMGGQIILKSTPKTGMVKIGSHCLGIKDVNSSTMWDVSGTLIIKGKASIGRGSGISIASGAVLELGEFFTITGNSSIVCHKEITFGADCLLSWDVQVMDTDLHSIVNSTGEIINTPRPVRIGNHVWIGCRNVILKGVTIADNIIVSANSTLTKSCSDSNCVISGSGKDVVVLKRNVNWVR